MQALPPITASQMHRVVTPAGELVGQSSVDLDRAAELYRAMVLARTYDKKAMALQKQGRITTYPPFEGQEAAQIGSAAVLEPNDWMVPSYRDAAAMMLHGYPKELLLATRRGTELGGSPPESVNVLPPSLPVGSHMLHAVGIAWAEKLRGTNRISITYFGDGATSEGDFHETMNFAGVLGPAPYSSARTTAGRSRCPARNRQCRRQLPRKRWPMASPGSSSTATTC